MNEEVEMDFVNELFPKMVEAIRYSLFTITYGDKEARQERENQ